MSMMLGVTMFASSTGQAAEGVAGVSASSSHQVKGGVLGSPRKTTAKASLAKPSASALALARRESQRRPLAGPSWATHTPASALRNAKAGQITSAPMAPPSNSASPFSTFRNSAVTNSGITSTVSEPSTDQSGKNIFQTSNWTAQFSHDNGTSWTSLDPFTLFGSGFCCDQVTAYDPGHDTQLWLLQYNNHLTLASSSAGDLTSWCFYNLPASLVGLPGSEFDYNDMAVGSEQVNITTNTFDTVSGAYTGTAWLRLDLDAISGCASVPYQYTVRTDLFTLKVAQGVSDVGYAASTALDVGTGTTLRILTWPENTGTITTTNRAIPAFAYMDPNSGQQCSSADLVVTNWCQRTDSRILGAARGNGRLYFSFNVRQGAAGRPFPYTRVEVLSDYNLGFYAHSDLFTTNFANLYVSMSPDRRGHVGYVATFGGGTGTTHYFPSTFVGVVDQQTPFFPGVRNFVLFGAGNGCLNGDGLQRWGDYNTVRGGYTGAGVWTAAMWARTTNTAVGCGTPVPMAFRNIVFGRARDLASYTRFYNN